MDTKSPIQEDVKRGIVFDLLSQRRLFNRDGQKLIDGIAKEAGIDPFTWQSEDRRFVLVPSGWRANPVYSFGEDFNRFIFTLGQEGCFRLARRGINWITGERFNRSIA